MRIRQGNDFIFLWAIERNGEPEDFSNAENIRLHFKNYDCVGEVKSFQIVDGNIVRVEVSPEWASRLGAYRLILSYEFEDQSYSDGDRKCVVDVLAFNIVPKTSEADDVTEMAKTTDIMVGMQGLSAYDVWLKDNPESTKEDYYNWLRQPATDIAETVGLQEQARVEAENTRRNNEEQRVTAETNRQNNFNSFIEVSESAVNTFIGTAQDDINEAISNAETATENANTAATNADNARLAIQDDLALKADHGYSSNPKTLKEVDDVKANHGYASTEVAKTLKDVEDDVEQLAYVKIKNEAVNGNFENGLIEPFSKVDYSDGESNLVINSSSPISGNYDARFTITTPATEGVLFLGGLGKTNGNIGDKIYLHFNAKILSGIPSIRGINVGLGAGILRYGGDVINGRNTRIIDVEGTMFAGTIYFNPMSVWDMQMDNFMFINLTETFGAGNEPTEEEMNLLISNLGIDYFEGEITIPAQKLMQWQRKPKTTTDRVMDATTGVPLNETLGKIIHEEEIFDGKYYNPIALASIWDTIDTERFPEAVSIIFPVKKWCDYTVIKKEPSDRFRIALFDQNPENQNGLKAVRVITPHLSDESGAKRSFKVENENEKYAVVQISISLQEPDLNVFETKLVGKGDEAYEIATENKDLLDSWKTTKDIFDGKYYNDFIISSGSGLINWGTGRFEGGVGVIARLTPYAKYHINRVEITDRFRIGICSSYPKNGMAPDRIIDALNSDKTADFIAKENENWLVIQLVFNSENKTPEIQIIEDNIIFNRKTTTDIEDANLDYLFENNPRNLFKGLQDEIALQTDNSVIIEKEGFLSSIVKIEADQRYTINLNRKNQSSYKISFFSSYPEIGDNPLRVLTATSNEDIYIKTGENEKYLLISDFPVGEETILYVDYYESSGLVIADKYLDKAPKILGQFNSLYNSLEIEPMPGEPYDFNNIYNAYDSLVNDFGDCISKNLLGYASDANGDEDTDMPIYEYVIKPPTNNLGGSYELSSPPTLLISSGVHGNEKEAIWCTYLFVKQMLNNYDADELLNSIKSNLILRIIPVVNPGGYNANTRANYNSVNINRNFETGWQLSSESGASPLSEPETKVIVKWFKEHHQAIGYIDYHNFSSTKGPNQVSYFISSNDKLRVMYSYMIRRLSDNWRKKYLNIPESNEALGYVNTEYSKNAPMTVADAYEIYGFKLSATIERRMGGSVFDVDNGLKIGVELLANYIGSLISTYFQ